MIRTLFACASLAVAIVAGGCSKAGTGGGPATLTIQIGDETITAKTEPPAGTDPASTTEPPSTTPGTEPPGDPSDPTPMPPDATTIPELCARACVHVQSLCPGALGGPDCTNECTASALDSEFAACMPEFRRFLICLAQEPIMCMGDSLDGTACATQIEAILQCAGAL